MDTFLNILAVTAVALVVFLAVGFVGFKVPAPLRRPKGEPTAPLSNQALPVDLPPLARKWIYQDTNKAAIFSSLVAWGRGKIASRLPLIGKVWMPLSWTLYLIPGKNFIIQNRVTWFGRRFIRIGEEYRDGKGSFVLGAKTAEKPYLDETEQALVWFYSIWLAPASLIEMKAVSLIETEVDKLRLVVNQDNNTSLNFDLDFDSTTGLLQSITGTRKGSRTGESYPYIASLALPKIFDEAGIILTQYTANWDNDIYVKFELAGIAMNQDVSEAMQTGVEEMPPL